MRYCFNCNHVTAGEPLFCNSCGRSYDVKLCPRLHLNPRNSEACSQCGSREFSTPQPKVPIGLRFLTFSLTLLPGIVLTALTFGLIVAILSQPDMLVLLALMTLPLAVLVWMWTKVPLAIRKLIYRLLQSKRSREDRSRR